MISPRYSCFLTFFWRSYLSLNSDLPTFISLCIFPFCVYFITGSRDSTTRKISFALTLRLTNKKAGHLFSKKCDLRDMTSSYSVNPREQSHTPPSLSPLQRCRHGHCTRKRKDGRGRVRFCVPPCYTPALPLPILTRPHTSSSSQSRLSLPLLRLQPPIPPPPPSTSPRRIVNPPCSFMSLPVLFHPLTLSFPSLIRHCNFPSDFSSIHSYSCTFTLLLRVILVL